MRGLPGIGQEYENDLPPINERKIIDMVCDLIGLEEWETDWGVQFLPVFAKNQFVSNF